LARPVIDVMPLSHAQETWTRKLHVWHDYHQTDSVNVGNKKTKRWQTNKQTSKRSHNL